MKHAMSIESFRLLGGQLCLDFSNTIEPRSGNTSYDLFTDYSVLVEWCQHVGVLTEDESTLILRDAEMHSSEAQAIFERAIALRETMYRVFVAAVRKTAPQQSDLDALATAFTETMKHACITPTANESFVWNWTKSEDKALEWMLWPLVRSAVELLTSQEVKKVKECPGLADCGWLFLDTSKNGSRQWCSMEGCGSRAKMRRQYARKRTPLYEA